jgi:hypothetical protein
MLTLSELQAITDYYVEKTPNDIYFKSNVLLYKLLGGQTGTKLIPGGKKIQVILEYTKGNSGSYGNTTKLPLGKKEIYNAAFFRWAAYFAGVTIDLDDQRQNSGDLAIVNLVNGKLKNAQKSIRTDMGGDIYLAAADSNRFNGLGDLFNTTTSTPYGEIAEDDMAEWKAVKTTAPSAAISFQIMQAIRRGASIDDNKEGKPDLYITTELLKDGFERTLQTQARYSDVNLINAGFDNILFGGAPVVTDNKQAAGTCDAINTNFLDILTHEDYNFTKPVWANPIDQPDLKVAFIRWSGNLICRNRKAHHRRENLTEPA